MSDTFTLDTLTSISSYSGRMKYCKEHFVFIKGGTGRAVFDMGNGNVIKLAKNAKGLAQNSVESDGFISMHDDDIINPCLDSDGDDLWLVTKKLEPVSISELRALFEDDLEGARHAMRELGDFVLYRSKKGSRPECEEDTLVHRLDELCMDYDLLSGDFENKSSWGRDPDTNEYKLVDFGLNADVFKEHYMTKRPAVGYGM